MDNRNIFSIRLFQLRKSHKLSLESLGNIIGISNQAVSLLEKGKNVPSFNVLLAIAEYFNVSLDYLVGRSDDSSLPNNGIASCTKELTTIYNSLDDDYKELLIRRARQIAKMAAGDLADLESMDNNA